VLPRILITCPGSQGTSCPCSLFMIRVEVPGSSLMLCLGPVPPSLLHLTRANAEKPYAGDTGTFPVIPKPNVPWQCPIVQFLRPGVPFSEHVMAPSGKRLRAAVSAVMRKAGQPHVLDNGSSVVKKWREIRANPRLLTVL
jgi:hypothetical protein